MPPLSPPLSTSHFTLDSSGIAGFFGGEEGFAAMNSVHLIPSRRWFGWYNSPGSYFIAKKYGTLPTSTFWDGLFPGPSLEPAELLEIDAKKSGPRYTGAYSGTRQAKSGHLCYLLSRHCRMTKVENLQTSVTTSDDKIPFTIVKFPDDSHDWAEEEYYRIPDKAFPQISFRGQNFILSTIVTSISLSILSAFFGDWYTFGLILYGAVANGITLLILGSGVLYLNLAQVRKNIPPGDGILFDETSMTILLGPERTISTILRSRYQLKFQSKSYGRIGFCCILLLLQFLLQLLLIPQGQLIGQVLFLVTLAVSWMCNGYLASKDLEDIQTDILLSITGRSTVLKVNVQRWTQAVALAIFFLSQNRPDLNILNGVIEELLSNDTPAWKLWRQCMHHSVKESKKPSSTQWRKLCEREGEQPIYAQLNDEERLFVNSIVAEADAAYDSVPKLLVSLAAVQNSVHAQHTIDDIGKEYDST